MSLADAEARRRIFEKLGATRSAAGLLGNLGNLWKGLGDFEKALGMYERALKALEQDGTPEDGTTPAPAAMEKTGTN